MAAADPLLRLEVPGRVIVDPTAFDATAHGGTDLGLVEVVRWTVNRVHRAHTAQELQAQTVGYLFVAEAVSLAFALRGNDDDARAVAWENTEVGSISQHRLAFGPPVTAGAPAGQVGPGTLLEAATARKVLFVPDDPVHHDAVYFPVAIPRTDEALALEFARSVEALTPLIFTAVPPAAGRVYRYGRLADFAGVP